MGLFGFGKRMEEETKGGCSCTCGGNGCHIKVLGAGCKFCHEQHENVKKAVENMSLDAEVEYITDMEKVMSYGVMSMPAIVVNDQPNNFSTSPGFSTLPTDTILSLTRSAGILITP